MAYVSQWERLSAAVDRVMAATGSSRQEAQTGICRAIDDGAVKFQAKLRKHTTRPFYDRATILRETDFEIPNPLQSKGFDWEESRPSAAWFVRRGSYPTLGLWELEWIELSVSHVTNVLCTAGDKRKADQNALKATSAARRQRPARDRARAALKELYPHGVPDQAVEPHKILCRCIGDLLKRKGLLGVSDDTILRAAGRRK